MAPTERLAWPATCLLLALASIVVWSGAPASDLSWNAALWTARPWTLWSASLVHLTRLHLLVNLLALGVLAVLGASLQAGGRATVSVLLAWPLGTLGLLIWPPVSGYSGLSGLLCAMLGVLWVHAAVRPALRAQSWFLLLALGLKLLSERAWTYPIGYDPQWGFNVVYAAHLSGALSGILCALVALRAAPERTP